MCANKFVSLLLYVLIFLCLFSSKLQGQKEPSLFDWTYTKNYIYKIDTFANEVVKHRQFFNRKVCRIEYACSSHPSFSKTIKLRRSRNGLLQLEEYQNGDAVSIKVLKTNDEVLMIEAVFMSNSEGLFVINKFTRLSKTKWQWSQKYRKYSKGDNKVVKKQTSEQIILD